MLGTDQSKITVTLRNPLDFNDLLVYTIIPVDNQLARDWVEALKLTLANGNLLEKNFCFLGFPNTARTVEYLCNQLNQAIVQINLFNRTKAWQDHGLPSYVIEEYFSPDAIRFGSEYPPGYDNENLGMGLKHEIMNRIHNHFEHLQGTVWNLSEYYKLADYETKYAIRQLNNICHELESLVLSQRKQALLPKWIRPSQITTFLHAERYDLTDEHRELFKQNGYDRQFGHVYMHWAQIGKTLLEVFRDEGAPKLTDTVCDAINHLKYYSGEFDVEWAADVVYGDPNVPWHNKEIDEFRAWLIDNNLNLDDPQLSLGYLPIGKINIEEAFGTTETSGVWEKLGKYLDIYSIEVDGVKNTFNYCWSDNNYKQQQIDIMKPGYDFSSRR
jgi:hypothetical protein